MAFRWLPTLPRKGGAMMTQRTMKRTRRGPKQSRADKAAEIQDKILLYWRTHSDRQIAEMVGCSNRTVGRHRQRMEDAGEILPRFDESTHSMEPCLHEVCTFAIEPAPENDKLYDPIREDDPDFLSFVELVRQNGITDPIGVSVDGWIFSGHRRHRAATRLGMTRVPVLIRPDVSHRDDLDGFVRLLKSCNAQRVKTTAEVVRESLVTMEPDTWQRVCDYRASVSNVDGAEVSASSARKNAPRS